jgi:hypothetical protein
MKTPNEFWLMLHTLAEAYDWEGETPQERAENIIEEFRRMPATARQQVKTNLEQLALALPELVPFVAVAEREEESASRPSVRRKKIA